MILEKIKKDQLQARKDKDKMLAGILGCLVGEVSIVGKNDGNRETTDEEALKVIAKFRKDAGFTGDKLIEGGIDNNYTQIQEVTYEIEVYESYLPKQMTADEIAEKIGIFMGDNANANMGQIMGYLSQNFKGLYDGKTASTLIKELLQ